MSQLKPASQLMQGSETGWMVCQTRRQTLKTLTNHNGVGNDTSFAAGWSDNFWGKLYDFDTRVIRLEICGVGLFSQTASLNTLSQTRASPTEEWKE